MNINYIGLNKNENNHNVRQFMVYLFSYLIFESQVSPR